MKKKIILFLNVFLIINFILKISCEFSQSEEEIIYEDELKDSFSYNKEQQTDDFNELVQYFRNNCSKISFVGNVTLDFLSDHNRFLLAKQDFEENSTIFSFEFDGLIHILNPRVKSFCQSLGLNEFEESNIFINQFDCLVFFMLNLLKYNTNSSDLYSLYIKTLPYGLDKNIFFLEDDEIDLIKNSTIFNQYNNLLGLIEEYSHKLSNSSLKDQFSENDIIYVHYITNTRNIGIEIDGSIYNVISPFLDLINYFPEKINTVIYENIKDNNKIFLKSTQNIKKGEEIIIDYGQKNNIELFTVYGFTLENNSAPKYIKNSFFIMLDFDYFDIDLYAENPKSHMIEYLNEIMDKQKIGLNEMGEYLNKEKEILEKIEYELKNYLNKERINKLKQKIKDKKKEKKEISENYEFDLEMLINIYRALVEEDYVLDKNYNAVTDLINGNIEDSNELKTTGKITDISNKYDDTDFKEKNNNIEDDFEDDDDNKDYDEHQDYEELIKEDL